MINKNNNNPNEFNPDISADDPDAEVGGDKKKLEPKAIVFILFVLLLLIGLFFLFSSSSEEKEKPKEENSSKKLSLPSSEPPKISIFDQKPPPPPEKDESGLDLIKKRQLDFSNADYLALKSAEELKYQQESQGVIKRLYGSNTMAQPVVNGVDKQDMSDHLIKKRTADSNTTSTLMVSESVNSSTEVPSMMSNSNISNTGGQKDVSQPELLADDVDFSDLIKDEAAYMEKFSLPSSTSKASSTKSNETLEKVLGDSVNADNKDGADNTGLRKEPYHTTVLARRVPMNPSFFIPQGTHIRCVMETIVISDVDGPTTCIVPENIRSFNGLNVLIPKGSRVIGEYKKTDSKEERVPMIWTRLITPDNIDISLNSSPGTTMLGAVGVGGSVDKRWGERLFTATLISLGIDAFAWKVVDRLPKKTRRTVVNGAIETEEIDFNSTTVKNLRSFTESELNNSLQIPYRLVINQGTVGSISVVRDLDFSSVYADQKGFR